MAKEKLNIDLSDGSGGDFNRILNDYRTMVPGHLSFDLRCGVVGHLSGQMLDNWLMP